MHVIFTGHNIKAYIIYNHLNNKNSINTDNRKTLCWIRLWNRKNEIKLWCRALIEVQKLSISFVYILKHLISYKKKLIWTSICYLRERFSSVSINVCFYISLPMDKSYEIKHMFKRFVWATFCVYHICSNRNSYNSFVRLLHILWK